MPQPGSFARTAVIAAAAAGLAAALAAAAGAQTLSEPNPKAKSPASQAAKAQPLARVKTCAVYGAGFAEVPGTGTCIKIGGFVETTVSGRR
ncbi:MAG TPA: porin [Bryobacteraceae bacterium]|nr:porin [Bryobacteraceae bacterium]